VQHQSSFSAACSVPITLAILVVCFHTGWAQTVSTVTVGAGAEPEITPLKWKTSQPHALQALSLHIPTCNRGRGLQGLRKQSSCSLPAAWLWGGDLTAGWGRHFHLAELARNLLLPSHMGLPGPKCSSCHQTVGSTGQKTRTLSDPVPLKPLGYD
jgi:hypothetical protein